VTQKESIRIVLDTNQIVGAGTRWLEDGQTSSNNNVHRRILIRVAQSHKGLYCGKVIGEYLEKLVDLHHPPARIVKMVAYIMGAFNMVEITTITAPYAPTDPDDEIFLLCALDGHADYLISEDRSLLNLKSNYSPFVIGCAAELSETLGANGTERML
jgi:predicted nucleic acid-binding protein